eukprot:NODE_2500_length_1405_cov_96.230109_g2378_i0.p1 GENE.NODE_2500_length_1405_cov_96.230109_g2378_i0~~NODE_2500_length_1405_cov_96.230109_g2378_i0.p1  ORF type:complete len:416 (+),score=42.48 NODE_2500_length_1405_cov_96.230109_g2378_i0:90-1337(+)
MCVSLHFVMVMMLALHSSKTHVGHAYATHRALEVAPNVRFYVYDVTCMNSCYAGFLKKYEKHAFMKSESHLSQYFSDVFFYRHLHKHPSVTTNPAEAQMFIVPTLGKQWKAVDFDILRDCAKQLYDEVVHCSPYWQRSAGVDHVLMDFYGVLGTTPMYHLIMDFRAWSPFTMAPGSPTAKIVAKFTELIPKVVRLDQDIVVPYWDPNRDPSFTPMPITERPIVAAFHGNWAKAKASGLRKAVVRALNRFPNQTVSVAKMNNNKIGQEIFDLLSRSQFCICPRGSGGWSTRRLQTAVLAGCVPVVVSDGLIAPFEELLDYSSFTIWETEQELSNTVAKLMTYDRRRMVELQKGVLRVRRHFLFDDNHGANPDGPIDMTLAVLGLRYQAIRGYRGFLNRQAALRGIHMNQSRCKCKQ